jgi:hypothetical protein
MQLMFSLHAQHIATRDVGLEAEVSLLAVLVFFRSFWICFVVEVLRRSKSKSEVVSMCAILGK